jgi:hypothetical protein
MVRKVLKTLKNDEQKIVKLCKKFKSELIDENSRFSDLDRQETLKIYREFWRETFEERKTRKKHVKFGRL